MTETPEPKPEERPEWLPEKFKDPSEMAVAYGELEKRLAAPQEPPPETPPETPPAPETAPEIGELTLTPPAAPESEIDFGKYDQEILATGDISDASVKEIMEKTKVPEPMIRSYVQAKKAEAAAALNELVSEVGGMETYRKFQEWARSALTPAQQAAFDSQLGSTDPEVRKMAVRGVFAQFQAAAGNPEAGMIPQGTPGTSAKPAFRSEAEFQTAIADPRYATDDAYRAEVDARTAESLKRGTITL